MNKGLERREFDKYQIIAQSRFYPKKCNVLQVIKEKALLHNIFENGFGLTILILSLC